MGELIVRFLQRKGAKQTWYYERLVLLPIELLCLLAGIGAAPDIRARVWLIITLPLAMTRYGMFVQGFMHALLRAR